MIICIVQCEKDRTLVHAKPTSVLLVCASEMVGKHLPKQMFCKYGPDTMQSNRKEMRGRTQDF